jgi:hypothetical protein
LHNQDQRIEEIAEWDIMLLQDDSKDDFSPMTLLPERNDIRLKMLCLTLAGGDTLTMQRLYEETDFADVIEMNALKRAYMYRPKENQ